MELFLIIIFSFFCNWIKHFEFESWLVSFFSCLHFMLEREREKKERRKGRKRKIWSSSCLTFHTWKNYLSNFLTFLLMQLILFLSLLLFLIFFFFSSQVSHLLYHLSPLISSVISFSFPSLLFSLSVEKKEEIW